MSTEPEQQNATIAQILAQIKKAAFKATYNPSDEQAMGVLLARYFHWDDIAILTAASHGLEEANSPVLAGQLNRLIKQETTRTARQIARQERAAQRGTEHDIP